MYPCRQCGHHHCIRNGPTLPCNGLVEDDDGGISKCQCNHTDHREEAA